MKKKMIITLVLVSLFTASCSRYVSEGPRGACGVWYPKKCKVGTKGW